jgi:acetyl esterase/lipase
MITDWDDAYDNRGYIENADSYPARWAALAQAFRNETAIQGRCELNLAYGSGDRERLDLFHPLDAPRGLVVFAHGGYWKTFDKSY